MEVSIMPDIFGGHERRAGRQARRHGRRRVRFGELFDSDELEAGTVELEEVDPEDGPEDEGEATEPWGWDDKPMPGRVRARLEGYQSFLTEWRRDHPDEDTGQEPEPEETEV